MAKAAIYKDLTGRWKLLYPSYGFHRSTSTTHDSHAAAISALTNRHVSGGSSTINETRWFPTCNASAQVKAATSARSAAGDSADQRRTCGRHERC